VGLGRWALGALLTSGIGLFASGTSAQILTLEDIEARAQRERPELAERQADIERAQAELVLVHSRSAPTIGGRVELALAPGGQLVNVRDALDGPGGDTYLVQGSRTLGQEGALLPQPRYAAMFAGRMTLLDFGQTKSSVRAAEASISAERAALIQAKVELVQSARGGYLSWVEAHQTWQLAERDAEVTAARSVSVRELITEGVRPATDATLSTYDEQLARLRQSRARRAVDAALHGLSAIVQSELPPRSVPDLDVIEPGPVPPEASDSANVNMPNPPATAAGAARVNKTTRESTLTAIELRREAALAAARVGDVGTGPVLSALAEVGIQGQDENVFPMYRAGLSLTVPLWDGGVSNARAAVHQAEARGLEAHQHAAERALDVQQRASLERWRAALEDLRLSQELLATSETVLSEAEDHYRSGSDTLERVLTAQRSLVQARREVLTAKLEMTRARLELTPVPVEP
jgi:outer membrane protein